MRPDREIGAGQAWRPCDHAVLGPGWAGQYARSMHGAAESERGPAPDWRGPGAAGPVRRPPGAPRAQTGDDPQPVRAPPDVSATHAPHPTPVRCQRRSIPTRSPTTLVEL